MTASYLARFLPAPNLVRRLTAALVFLVLAGFAAAQDAPLKVAVYDVSPYGHVESDGSIDGLSVDLWRRAAESLGRQYHLVPVTQMEEVLKGLERKDYDAAIGAITITPARLARVDFSYPAHRSGAAGCGPPGHRTDGRPGQLRLGSRRACAPDRAHFRAAHRHGRRHVDRRAADAA